MAQNLYELLGIDQLGAERVMASRPARRPSPSSSRRHIYQPPAAMVEAPSASMIRDDLVSRFPGVSPQGLLGWPMGFDAVTFVNAGLTTLFALANPQRPIKGNRLIIAAARTGATSTGLLTVDQIQIGTTPQQISNAPLPVEMFAFNATDIILDLQQAQPGIQCRLTYTLGLPLLAVGDTVGVSASLMSITAG